MRESGIALVITLILLSVITFMAVTFLVVTRGERGNVSVLTEQTTARLAADAAVEAAKAELIAPMLAFSNTTIGLIVSTNYQSPWFTNGSASFLNVNYVDQNGAPLTGNNALQNLANMLYLPRVPVFITNRIYGSNEFRFYVDLNRNGRFDTNGLVPLQDQTGAFVDPSGKTVSPPYFVPMTGDPEWVGILERGGYTPGLLNGPSGLTFPKGYGHSSSNLFISRYSFIVVPASLTLDVNNIHNYAKGSDPLTMKAGSGDGFLRNMGAGSWEINLAAFLADLNTNIWSFPKPAGDFQYLTDNTAKNSGVAFEDALSLLRYRYNANPQKSLSSVTTLFGGTIKPKFAADQVDGYSKGPVMTGFHWMGAPDLDSASVDKPWSGADNTNHFFDTQDFFDPNKAAFGASAPTTFVSRLAMAGTNASTYDRYTFYRLLSQLGTDSDPEPPKMNLNYANIDANGKIVPDMATNFLPWAPVQFFTNAAIRLLADAGYDTNVVNKGQIHIQIYPTNYYVPSVHRQLQLAANIYDSTTSNSFPSVFRPSFVAQTGAAGQKMYFINGYTEVTNANLFLATPPTFLDAADLNSAGQVVPGANIMFYGVPFVVGAKKGLPNFNEFAMLNDAKVVRRLVFTMDTNSSPVRITTNQQYSVSVSNVFGVEAWNSYAATYPNAIQMVVATDVLFGITNQNGLLIRGVNGLPMTTNISIGLSSNIVQNSWFGFQSQSPLKPTSFIIPYVTNYVFLSNAVYSLSQNQFQNFAVANLNPDLQQQNLFPIPHCYLNLTNRVRFILIDSALNRIVDYVNLNSIQPPVDVTDAINRNDNGAQVTVNAQENLSQNTVADNQNFASLFDTNRPGASLNLSVPTYGIAYQMQISAGTENPTAPQHWWDSFNGEPAKSRPAATLDFRHRIAGDDGYRDQKTFAAPFSPVVTIHQFVSWQANDPLVHYTIPDLTDRMNNLHFTQVTGGTLPVTGVDSPLKDFGGFPEGARVPLNTHYRPWGGNNRGLGVSETTPIDTNSRLEVKDPLVKRSDDWDFSTNKFPNIGWLGRVHRGSPWQTVNLKALQGDAQLTNRWAVWSGHVITNWDGFGSVVFDSANSNPTNDFRIMDLFTTAFNDNASRGQLSVNQSGLAAWSAILSGVIVNTNSLDTNGLPIQPAGVYNPTLTNTWSPLLHIVDGINRTRATAAVFTNGVFNRLGDILYTPELTLTSPFLNTNNTALLSDEAYERIPQQIMSLLRNDTAPRFVIYAFGQALKPAEHSIYLGSGQFFGMVTNYQITAEVATRAVVHVEGAPASPHVIVDSYNVLGPY